MKWIPALSLTPFHQWSGVQIKVGSRIKIYGKETTVLGFRGSYNEGLEKWETIILTEGRGDPFERSMDVIEVQIDSDETAPTVVEVAMFTYGDMMDIAGWMAAADCTRPIPELKEEAEVYIKTKLAARPAAAPVS